MSQKNSNAHTSSVTDDAGHWASYARLSERIRQLRGGMGLKDGVRQKDADNNPVRALAFYLPQFHPIPENDAWWGKGFTEWTNVSKAKPNFKNHYQPHLPGELGFYDLRVQEIMEQQAALAKAYGVHGFCYFYYWFGGKRVLEMPLERMLETNVPDFPFCLLWANENWTRRWDGLDKEILIAQKHSPEDDEAVIMDLIRYMRHPRYIRIDGKPLVAIYRIGLFPDIRKTVEIWRNVCRREGIGDIYLAMAETLYDYDMLQKESPSQYGLDASIEYPPHVTGTVMDTPELVNLKYDGFVKDYEQAVLERAARKIPSYTRFRGIMPSWDNTSRQQDFATTFINSSPGAYQAWLEMIIEDTIKHNKGEERIVFINAWNEWAEGAHLEPDRLYGHAWLEATRNALNRFP